MLENLVTVYHDPEMLWYPKEPPFSPADSYPDAPFKDRSTAPNPIYRAVRAVMKHCGLDADHYATEQWNPLGQLIQPGQTVLLKPNCVLDFHGWGWDIESVITHASIVRAVADYAVKALRGKGRLIIGDAPLQSANFEKVCSHGLKAVVEYLQARTSVSIELVDFRREHAYLDDSNQIMKKERHIAHEDLSRHRVIDLSSASMFRPVSELFERYRVTNYDPAVMPANHNRQKNAYLVAAPVVEADVIIGLPKLKTHRKAGMTCALKNQIGINGQKDWLPHHRRGSAQSGGDEYMHASVFKSIADTLVEREDVSESAIAKKVLRYTRAAVHRIGRLTYKDRYLEGSWYGNDTIWRTLLDLNRILLYADRNGIMRDVPQRKLFFLVDAVIAGDHEGPLEPTNKPCGMIIAGFTAPTVDAVAARVMGFDYRKIPSIREAFHLSEFPLVTCKATDIAIVSNSDTWRDIRLDQSGPSMGFAPSLGWQGHIELEERSEALNGPGELPANSYMTYRGQRLP